MNVIEEFPDLLVLQRLNKQKKTPLFLVGGYLRNQMLKKSSTDLDFTVQRDAINMARHFADAIQGSFVMLDEKEGSARVVRKYKGRVVTYDFTDFRAKTLKQDLKRRDFTVNTLCLDVMRLKPESDHVFLIKDYYGAQNDITTKTVRMLSAQSLDDDPLRLLRAFTLKASYGFKLDKLTEGAIKERVTNIHHVSTERIRDELFKIFESPRATTTLRHMHRLKLLVNIIPQLHVMFGVEQGGYHHLDVWRHSLEVVHQFEKIVKVFSKDDEVMPYFKKNISGTRSRLGLVKLGCLLHDIGKPETKEFIDGRWRFHTHEHVGKNISTLIARQLKLGTKERHVLEDMVVFHLRPGYLSNHNKPTERMYYRYFRDTGEEAVSIALLSLADQRSTRGPLTTKTMQRHHEKICMEIVRRFFLMKKSQPFVSFVNGRDIMSILKIKSSPRVGMILEKVKEQQALGRVKNKEEALKLVKQIGAE